MKEHPRTLVFCSVPDKKNCLENTSKREVNSKKFDNAEQLQNYIAEVEGSLVFKLAVKIDQPDPVVTISPFMKAYFTYRPDRDNFLPDKNLGLPFSAGDVLQIHDKSDKLFWQAENVATKEKGLIPSEWLEDRRRTRKIRKESKKTQLNNEIKTKLFSASQSQVGLGLVADIILFGLLIWDFRVIPIKINSKTKF